MKTKRTLTIATVLVALAALLTLGVVRGTRNVQAQDQLPPPVGDRISFGMVGLTQGQTARINVSNVIAQNDSRFPPGPIRVAIVVINSHGDPFRNRDGSPVRKVTMLNRGESTFLELNGDDFPTGAGGRIQLRAVITENPPPIGDSNPFPPGPVTVQSIEVINNANARTVLFMGKPGVIRGFNPQPDPPAGD
jgi:hypothetical protein